MGFNAVEEDVTLGASVENAIVSGAGLDIVAAESNTPTAGFVVAFLLTTKKRESSIPPG
jgi:hypothetical protein